jgi:hypothetical protein
MSNNMSDTEIDEMIDNMVAEICILRNAGIKDLMLQMKLEEVRRLLLQIENRFRRLETVK